MRNLGFSLIELTVVIIVIGILAAILVPRTNSSGVALGTQAEQLAADIRYVQSLAMTQGWTSASPPATRRYRVNLTATSYSFADWSGVAISHPVTGSTAAVSLDSRVRISPFPATGLAANVIGFDGQGVPYTDSNVTTALASTATIVLVADSGESRSISIVPQTGMVYLP